MVEIRTVVALGVAVVGGGVGIDWHRARGNFLEERDVRYFGKTVGYVFVKSDPVVYLRYIHLNVCKFSLD